MKTLQEYYKGCGAITDLEGLRVFDTRYERYLYLMSVEGGLWCEYYPATGVGAFYEWARLRVPLNEYGEPTYFKG